MIGIPKAPPARMDTGMRRVSWVRIVLDDQGAHCHVLGVGHRIPRARPITLDTALALAAAGVPSVVRSAERAEKLQPVR